METKLGVGIAVREGLTIFFPKELACNACTLQLPCIVIQMRLELLITLILLISRIACMQLSFQLMIFKL
jgi:hypothetical protein